MRRLVGGWLVVAWLVAGCGLIGEATPEPPRPCGEVYGAVRCLAMTDAAAAEVGRTRDEVTATVIVPYPPPKDGILETLGGARAIKVRVAFADGTDHVASMCGGLPSGPACTETPTLVALLAFADGGGYKDVPCPDGSPPHSCGTPLPTLQPAAVASARSLAVAGLSIPIDHLGAYEVPLGEASLPNGIGSVGSFGFVDGWPADVSLKDGSAQLQIRSLEPDGKPFQNYYDHGWRPGAERVEAILAFDVLWFRPGAVLAIRDIEVH